MHETETATATRPSRSRSDANRIAIRAARSILDAAAPLTLAIEGARVEVAIERLPAPPWPERGADGLSPNDGPWPRPAKLDCRWEGGRAVLVMTAALGCGRGPLVGVRVASASTNRGLVWINLPSAIRDAADGERVWVGASLRAPARRERGAAMRELLGRSGLPLAGRRATAFALRVPEGEILPLPHDAFTNLVRLALIELPFAPDAGLEGRPPFDPDAITSPPSSRRPDAPRLAKIHPLPGGVRRYQATLDALVAFIGEATPVSAFRAWIEQQHGAGSADASLRLLEGAGLVLRSGEALGLSEAGRRYREAPDPESLFEQLHAGYVGLLEALVIADTPEVAGSGAWKRVLEGALGKRWRTPDQASFRRNWLLSLGLTERSVGGDHITPLGRQVLGAHAPEAVEIRRRVEDLIEDEIEASFAAFDALAAEGEIEREDEDEPAAPSAMAAAPAPPDDAPPGWGADRIDLTVDRLRPHLGDLELPDRVLRRICAALSAGKHLLFVGPPGTGKTELAAALGEAARGEGYCHGVFPATASADWTTFDTIGGYALQKDGALGFRPGVFLAAIERHAWLLVDELNRADVDRAFGELMTVLAGRGTVTPFTREDGRLVSIGPEPAATHRVPPAFRLLATMNTWDKSSLFRLSYAVQRRFAIVHVPVPDDAAYARVLARHAVAGSEPPLDPRALAVLGRLFRGEGLLGHRPVGPAVPIDMIRYLRRRGEVGEGLAEAFAMYLLPQLEGLEPRPAATVYDMLDAALAGLSDRPARAELRARYAELFPHLDLDTP